MLGDRLDHCEKLKQLIATCFFASLAEVRKEQRNPQRETSREGEKDASDVSLWISITHK